MPMIIDVVKLKWAYTKYITAELASDGQAVAAYAELLKRELESGEIATPDLVPGTLKISRWTLHNSFDEDVIRLVGYAIPTPEWLAANPDFFSADEED